MVQLGRVSWHGLWIDLKNRRLGGTVSFPLNNEVKQMIAESKQIGEKLKHFPVIFELHLDDNGEWT